MLIQSFQRFFRTQVRIQDFTLEFCIAGAPWKSIPIVNLESLSQGSVLGFPLLHAITRSGGHTVIRGSASAVAAQLVDHLSTQTSYNLVQTRSSISSIYPTTQVLDATWSRLSEELVDAIAALRSQTVADYLGTSTELQT
ncbi:MAG: hypothetical protein AAB214_00815, partial [Fibrobacterota bacterium]